MQLLELGLEIPSRAHGIDDEQLCHRSVTGEHGKDSAQGDVGLDHGVGLAGHFALDAFDQPIGGRPHQLDEEPLLRREVEVDAAFRGLGPLGDLVDGGVAVARPGEHVERGVEDRFPPLAASLVVPVDPLGRLGAAGGIRAIAGHVVAPKQTDQSVGRLSAHGTGHLDRDAHPGSPPRRAGPGSVGSGQ